MKALADHQPIRASLLDRFGGESREQPTSAGRQDVRGLLHSVREHLDLLLNSRWRCSAGNLDLPELRASLVDYGIPDFSAISVSSPEGQEMFRDLVASAIRAHEPRILNLDVKVVASDQIERNLQLTILGDLNSQPDSVPIAFDYVLNSLDQRIERKSSAYVR